MNNHEPLAGAVRTTGGPLTRGQGPRADNLVLVVGHKVRSEARKRTGSRAQGARDRHGGAGSLAEPRRPWVMWWQQP